MNTTSFSDLQKQFSLHIKNPEQNSAPAQIESRRMAVYRELFFNNISGFLDSAFPVFSSLVTTEVWNRNKRHFFATHACQSPLFLDISKEYVQFLQQPQNADLLSFDFELELIHYEWLELSVSTRIEQHAYPLILNDETAQQVPLVFSELAESVSYAYPVQHISTEFMPSSSAIERQYLVLYRSCNHEVKFLQVNAVTAMLLELLKLNPGLEFAELIAALVAEIPQFPEEQVRQAAVATIVDLCHKGVIRQNRAKC